jgi:hypothetical protein
MSSGSAEGCWCVIGEERLLAEVESVDVNILLESLKKRRQQKHLQSFLTTCQCYLLEATPRPGSASSQFEF